MSQIVFPHRHIILDACCVINIYASGCPHNILRSLGATVAIADYVHDYEVNNLRTPKDSAAQAQSTINLKPLIACGLLTITSTESDSEEMAFVNLAADLDDGEAITGAIAMNRNWTMATDDRRSIAFLRRRVPALPIISTLDMVKHWVDATNPAAAQIQQAMHAIRIQATYAPGSSHPLYAWWQSHVCS